MFEYADTQGVWGEGGVDIAHQTLRGGSLQVQHGLSAWGRKSLCAPESHPHHLSCAAHSWAQRRGRPLAHLHAGCRARPQPRCGCHPSATRPTPHVWEGRHQAHGLHYWRSHRQADHFGLSKGWGECAWEVAEIRREGLCLLGSQPSRNLPNHGMFLCQIWPFIHLLFSPYFICHFNMPLQCKLYWKGALPLAVPLYLQVAFVCFPGYYMECYVGLY